MITKQQTYVKKAGRNSWRSLNHSPLQKYQKRNKNENRTYFVKYSAAIKNEI